MGALLGVKKECNEPYGEFFAHKLNKKTTNRAKDKFRAILINAIV